MSLEIMNLGIDQPLILALIIPALIGFFIFLQKGKMTRKKWLFFFSRTVFLTLIFTALAGPYMVSTTERFQDVSSLTILSDRSESTTIFQNDTNEFAQNLYSKMGAMLKNISGFNSIYFKEFSKGNATAIGDVLYQNSVESNKDSNLLVLVSDGNNNYGRDARDVAQAIGGTGSRILSVKPMGPKNEVYVLGITGDKKTPVRAKYSFTVDVGKLGLESKYRLAVSVDGKGIASSTIIQNAQIKHINFTTSFDSQGVHIITATITSEFSDFIDFNNQFTKTVDVVDKPKVLVVTDIDSPLLQILKENYDVAISNTVPRSLDNYVCVYLDNRNASQLSDEAIKNLNQYVINGNGLVVVGGDKAYEKGAYTTKPQLEAMLPVRSVKDPVKKRKEMAVVIVMDISESTAYGLGPNSKIQHEKDITANIIKNSLDPKDYVGLVAFNVEPFTIAEMKKLAEQTDLVNNVYSLRFGGGTDMLPALDRADQMISGYAQDKYVIIISDGVLGVRSGSRSILTVEKVKAMKDKGIKVHTVGVGFDTDEDFMSKLAAAGAGTYFKLESDQRLRMAFEDTETEKDKDRYKVEVSNKNHFITEAIDLPEAALKDYNDVTAKSIAQVLVTTEGKKPVVAVWRFGLGRVASITTDDGSKWSQTMYNVEGGKIVSAITNWVVGDLEKKKSVMIETADVTVGREANIYVKSNLTPQLFVLEKNGSSTEVLLKQTDVGLYNGKYKPAGSGFYALKAVNPQGTDADGISVNYPVEFSRLGTNDEELDYLAGATDGKSYNQSQERLILADVFDLIKKGSIKTTTEKLALETYLMILLLALFFVDTVIRRIQDIRRLREGR